MLAATACDGDEPTSPQGLEGEYELVSINASGLPFVLSGPPPARVVESGQLEIAANGHYSGSIFGRTLQDFQNGSSAPHAMFEDAGTASLTGSALTFTSTTTPGLSYVGSRDGSFITFSIPGSAVGGGGRLTLGFLR